MFVYGHIFWSNTRTSLRVKSLMEKWRKKICCSGSELAIFQLLWHWTQLSTFWQRILINSLRSKSLIMASIIGHLKKNWEWKKIGSSLFCHEKFLFVGRYHNPHLPPVFYYLGSAMAFSITCIQIHIRYSNYKGKKQWNML